MAAILFLTAIPVNVSAQLPGPPGLPPAAVGAPEPSQREIAETLSFDLPGPEKLFRLRSDAALREQIRQEARSRNVKGKIEFPEDLVLTDDVYQGRMWPRLVEVVEPYYVCYRRTYFDQINFERYGWDFGIVQPVVCAGKFYWDVFWLPYHVGTEPLRHFECNRGYCLPGDPVPFALYPPQFSATGAALQVGAVTGLGFALP